MIVKSLIKEDRDAEEPSHMWTRESAFIFLKEAESVASEYGYHVALAGSVMYRGYSDKDLDVIFYPHDSRRSNESVLGKVFDDLNLKSFDDEKSDKGDKKLLSRVLDSFRRTKDFGSSSKPSENTTDEKDIGILKDSLGRRIDIFVLK